jgi:hypothetical protein
MKGGAISRHHERKSLARLCPSRRKAEIANEVVSLYSLLIWASVYPASPLAPGRREGSITSGGLPAPDSASQQACDKGVATIPFKCGDMAKVYFDL